jgi:hypothetical protein
MKLRLAALCLIQSVAVFGTVLGTGQEWTDRKEYDLVLDIRAEASPEKRLTLLDSWSQHYPKTALARARQELYLNTYEVLGDRTHMFDVARQMLTVQPDDPVGLYWLTILTPVQSNPTPAILDAGSKAAHKLLASTATYFSTDKKPPSLSDSDWQKQKLSVEVMAHRTIGWVSWQRGDLGAAEEDLAVCLQKDSGDAEVSSWLGIISAVDTNKQSLALWHFARATNIGSSAPLADEQRRQVNGMLENMYVSYHGSLEGLDQLKKISASTAFPPPGFQIDSATVVNARRAEAELSLTNPELASWQSIRRQLEASDGDKYFSSDIQGKPLPQLKGTVIKSTPPKAPQIGLSMSEPGSAEVTLKLTIPLARSLPAGTILSFRGNGESFTKDPFSLVITADTAEAETKPAKTP